MADVALLVIAADGLWVRRDRVPEDDRAQVLRAASAGLHVAVAARGDEAAFRRLRLMLHLDPIPILGAGYRTEVNGRLLIEAATSPEPVYDALIAALARGPATFDRRHVLAVGSLPADLPLLRAAALSAWVTDGEDPPEGEAVDLVARPLGDRDSGLGQAIEALALRNNRFRRPAPAHPRFTVL